MNSWLYRMYIIITTIRGSFASCTVHRVVTMVYVNEEGGNNVIWFDPETIIPLRARAIHMSDLQMSSLEFSERRAGWKTRRRLFGLTERLAAISSAWVHVFCIMHVLWSLRRVVTIWMWRYLVCDVSQGVDTSRTWIKYWSVTLTNGY